MSISLSMATDPAKQQLLRTLGESGLIEATRIPAFLSLVAEINPSATARELEGRLTQTNAQFAPIMMAILQFIDDGSEASEIALPIVSRETVTEIKEIIRSIGGNSELMIREINPDILRIAVNIYLLPSDRREIFNRLCTQIKPVYETNRMDPIGSFITALTIASSSISLETLYTLESSGTILRNINRILYFYTDFFPSSDDLTRNIIQSNENAGLFLVALQSPAIVDQYCNAVYIVLSTIRSYIGAPISIMDHPLFTTLLALTSQQNLGIYDLASVTESLSRQCLAIEDLTPENFMSNLIKN